MIRLGVIGYGGRMSGVVQHCLRAHAPELRVVGVVDPNEAGARGRLADCDKANAVFYPDADTMMRHAKLDAVAIGTRCHQHTPFAIAVSTYDVPLYLEKPVAITMEQATSLERAFEKSKAPVVVSFPLRVSPLCVMTRDYIEKGSIGSPEHILAVNYVPYGTCYFDDGYRNFEITQGLFLQKATHDFDYLMYLMGSPIVRVAAMAQWGRVFGGKKPAGLVCSKCDEVRACLESPENRKRNGAGGSTWDHPCVFGEEIGTPETGMNEDASSALVEFASGAKGVYTQVFYSRRDSGTRGATISGYHGTLSFDWYKNEMRYVRHHRPFSDVTQAGKGMSHFGGDDELARNFIDIVRGRTRVSRTPITAGIQSVYSCLAAKESAETGRFITVRQVGQVA